MALSGLQCLVSYLRVLHRLKQLKQFLRRAETEEMQKVPILICDGGRRAAMPTREPRDEPMAKARLTQRRYRAEPQDSFPPSESGWIAPAAEGRADRTSVGDQLEILQVPLGRYIQRAARSPGPPHDSNGN